MFISVLGSLLHFAYGLLPNDIIAFFVPVNESVWEHLKLSILPTALWAFAALGIFGRKFRINRRRWFAAYFAAQLVTPALITMLFYSYSGALGFSAVWADISTFFIAVAVSSLFAAHIYKFSRGLPLVISVGVILLTIIIMGILTFIQPQLPIFVDPLTGFTGII